MSPSKFVGGLFLIAVGAITGTCLGLHLHLGFPLLLAPTALGSFAGLYVAVKYFP